MVYDGTKSGLNDGIWVTLPPVHHLDTHLWVLKPGTSMGDMDVGEMFLNFVLLHESMQALCGVDLTRFFGGVKARVDESSKLHWDRWVQAAMWV
jgi:hypothetical protein